MFKNALVLFFLFVFCAVFTFAQETGSVKGKVRNQKGDGLSETSVTARKDGQEIKTVKTDRKGIFEMTGLKPGVYNFVFDKSGYASGIRFNVEVKGGKTVDLGDRLILSADRGTLVLIQGSVFNQDGRSITGAKVELERVNSDGSIKNLGTVYTNVSGEFAFRQPDVSGKFRVTASIKGVKESKEINVEGAAIYRTAITLNLKKEEEK
jgi:uncharacterized surface anchored protein